MIKRLAKILLVVGIILSLGCASTLTTIPATGIMNIKNSSDCYLFALTIGKMTLNDDTGGYDYELVIGKWIPVGEEINVELVIGQRYGILLEAYYFSKDDNMKATELVAEILKPGVFRGKEDSFIDLHGNCKKAQLREA